MNSQLNHIFAEQHAAEMLRVADKERLAAGLRRAPRERVRRLVGSRSRVGRIAAVRT